jgi:hypothetical protein
MVYAYGFLTSPLRGREKKIKKPAGGFFIQKFQIAALLLLEEHVNLLNICSRAQNSCLYLINDVKKGRGRHVHSPIPVPGAL